MNDVEWFDEETRPPQPVGLLGTRLITPLVEPDAIKEVMPNITMAKSPKDAAQLS